MANSSDTYTYTIEGRDQASAPINKAAQNLARFEAVAVKASRSIATVAIGSFIGTQLSKATGALQKTYDDITSLAAAREIDAIGRQKRLHNAEAGRYQAITAIAKRVGVSQSAVLTGTDNLTKSLRAASAGVDRYTSTFEELGITYEDADGRIRTTDSVIAEITRRTEQYGATADETAKLNRLFGGSFKAVSKVYAGGADSLEKYETALRNIGAVYTEQEFAEAQRLTSLKTNYDKALEAITNRALLKTGDFAVSSYSYILAFSEKASESFSSFVQVIATEIARFTVTIAAKIPSMMVTVAAGTIELIQKIAAMSVRFFGEQLPADIEKSAGSFGIVKDAISAVFPAFRMLDSISGSTAAGLKDQIESIADTIESNEVTDALDRFFKELEFITGDFEEIGKGWGGAIVEGMGIDIAARAEEIRKSLTELSKPTPKLDDGGEIKQAQYTADQRVRIATDMTQKLDNVAKQAFKKNRDVQIATAIATGIAAAVAAWYAGMSVGGPAAPAVAAAYLASSLATTGAQIAALKSSSASSSSVPSGGASSGGEPPVVRASIFVNASMHEIGYAAGQAIEQQLTADYARAA